MKLPLLSAQELIRFLKKKGFEEIRQHGSHKYFKHSDGRATIVPVHSGKDIGRGLLKKILNEIDVSREDFLNEIN
ncbi:MAG: type II toxin-antitoxin system HicA family toxin [Candidatus Woesearchaeota archaeon]|nr:type II toxin-antitoxin system HicA family toxin [Candidatus Woesearchaeota archaeon]